MVKMSIERVARKVTGYVYLEHTADVYVEAQGVTLEESFENAAIATMEVMTDTSKVMPAVERIIELEAEDIGSLLYKWLEELIVEFDVSGLIYSRFNVTGIMAGEEGLKLKAVVAGEEFDNERHTQRTGVKSVTYHMMEVNELDEGYMLRFVLDV
jgi:SHS2 domain-containing protein